MGLPPIADHPAVAVFREPRGGRPSPALDLAVEAEARRTARVLAEMATHGRPAERAAALWQVAATAGELVGALSALAPAVAGEDVPAESTSQSYFRVREVELSDQQAALHGALVVHRGLEDLREAPLSGADLALETAGMRQAVLDLTGTAPGAGPEPAPPATAPESGPSPSLESVWSARWLIGHQVHVLFNVCAAVAVADAARGLRHGDADAALTRLADATVYVRGFPAAMNHASAIPADHYMAEIRRTMAPPSTDIPLSGRQHRGYKLFRAAMKDLLTALPDSYDQLAARSPELADARGALLEADIVDAERHVTLAYSMVHLRRSIAQRPEGPDNAVAELRLMRHRRAAQYAPLIRFGDHYIADAVAGLCHP
ncbi:hypothetical protein TR51_10655 [Kitasatospora griseola]|uniref:Uncharacterized protein n=1 Tax=Kitasatospora griseola TaxID=2064 RepID=A0A0D0Q042_KITGR|nr:hypothetical protein [Kitasatospora griseola]KIQ65922.1 hypothetical protein TR51_10655 [Kitasatospora griseola]